jgi:CDP-diacylglycerol---glycerol-3-phosphate 3-phosphatidyltransferase
MGRVILEPPNPAKSLFRQREGCLASVYDLKPKFQNLLRPLCAAMARGGMTANQVTAGAMLLSIAGGAAIIISHAAPWSLLLLPVLLFVRMALNAIDGMLAREFGQKSRLGAVLNEMGDVISDTSLYLPFAVIPGVNALLVSCVVALAVMTEMAGVVAVQIGAERRYDGPFGKSDRAVFFGGVGFFLGLGIAPGLWTDALLVLAIAGSLLTIVNRARAALS